VDFDALSTSERGRRCVSSGSTYTDRRLSPYEQSAVRNFRNVGHVRSSPDDVGEGPLRAESGKDSGESPSINNEELQLGIELLDTCGNILHRVESVGNEFSKGDASSATLGGSASDSVRQLASRRIMGDERARAYVTTKNQACSHFQIDRIERSRTKLQCGIESGRIYRGTGQRAARRSLTRSLPGRSAPCSLRSVRNQQSTRAIRESREKMEIKGMKLKPSS
jgi:hypothetical protein